MSVSKNLAHISTETISEALVSVSGSVACAANILRISHKDLSYRIKSEEALLKLVIDIKELDLPAAITTGPTFDAMEKVLKACAITHAKPHQIEELTGIKASVQKRWLENDVWFREEWARIRGQFGERIINVIHQRALEGDWKAALEVARSEFPELGYVRTTQKPQEVVVNITHEGMLEALEQHKLAAIESSISPKE